MTKASTPLEERMHSLSGLIREPAAPGADPAGGKDAEGGGVLSLVYPTPDITGDTTKWGLARKNILTRLEEEDGLDARATAKIRAWVEAMDTKDLPEGGFAIYAEGEEMAAHALDVRPFPALHRGAIYALPALVDAARKLRYWTVVLDVEDPRLFYVSGGEWTDRTPDEVRTLSGEMRRTEPMAAVTFHSSGRPHIGKSDHAAAKFHALGAATTDLKAEEIDRVLTHFAGQVKDVIAGGTEPVLIAGDPKRCGLFGQHFDHPQLMDELHVAGIALELDELAERGAEAARAYEAERTRKEMEALDRNRLERDETVLLRAAREGKVEHVFLREDAAGLLSGDDERLKLDALADEGAQARSMIVAQAVKNGAMLTVFAKEAAEDLPEVSGTMRY
jgi:hypothetical protein